MGATQAASAFALLAVTACAATAPTRDAFHEPEFVWSTAPGTAKVTGQAFLTTMAGDVKYCAGREIVLIPYTRYFEAITNAERSRQRPQPHPEAYLKYRRTTIGDGQGNFEFTGLPAGRWVVSCYLTWMVDRYTNTGGYAEKAFDLTAGETKRVIATGN